MNRRHRRPLSKSVSRGFSLVEVVLAIGVVAFAIVAIMGMLPVAMNNALESKRESRAAFIASFLDTNLRATPFSSARAFDGAPTGLNLSVVGNSTVAFDESGKPLTTINDSAYQNGVTSPPETLFLARISTLPDSGSQKLCKVQIEVSTPAAAPASSRQKYHFASLIADRPAKPTAPAP